MKTVVITGCNKGLGFRLLERFSEKNYNIIAINRKEYNEFDRKISEIQKKCGNHITVLYAEFTDKKAIDDVVLKIVDMNIPVDILINNAGILNIKSIFNTEYSDLETSFKINYFAPVIITKCIASLMIRDGKGAIVNVSTTASIHSEAGASCYGASKLALNFFTESLAQELSPFGIRVNAVACGPMASTMYFGMDEKKQKKLSKRVSLGRIAELDEIADAILYLALDKSSYITGTVLPVDGGFK